jgi:predicted ATPase
MAEGGLERFVTKSGGADGFFFNGPKETRRIFANLAFGQNAFRFTLEPTASSEIVVTSQGTFWKGGKNLAWREYGGGGKESSLRTWAGDQSAYGPYASVEGCIYEAVASWIVYHFHDTSSTAPMRRDQSTSDYRQLRSDASNIASFLLKMQAMHQTRYQRIRETIQLIAPFFDDFLLEPEMKSRARPSSSLTICQPEG